MAAFDCETGKTLWVLKDEWGASYSSLTLAQIHNRTVCLAFDRRRKQTGDGWLARF